MKSFIALLAILPLVLAIELPGEELPSEKLETAEDMPLFDQDNINNIAMVKRSVNNIAARRRSALDKTFMRFGRSDPSMSNNRVKLSANLMRFGRAKSDSFMRLGRSKVRNIVRFGRSPNMMRFGRSDNDDDDFERQQRANLMRFGRSDPDLEEENVERKPRANLMRFGRANLMRFGRNPNMMRFGRSSGGNMMRFGRSNDDDFYLYDLDNGDFDIGDKEKKANAFMRLGRSAETVDRKNDNFMRLGRSTEASKIEMEMDEDKLDNNLKNNDSLDILFDTDPSYRRKRSSENKH